MTYLVNIWERCIEIALADDWIAAWKSKINGGSYLLMRARLTQVDRIVPKEAMQVHKDAAGDIARG